MTQKKRDYASLQDWMERTGSSQSRLLRLVNDKCPSVGLKKPHLSKILSGSRRCSLEKALALSMVTGVPVEKLTKWPAVDIQATSKANDETAAA